jgi:polyhydroxybutyrate depolymerase
MVSNCTLASTGGTIQRQVNGRDYWVNVPEGLPGPSAPLLLGLHGFLQTPVTEGGIAGHEQTTSWSDIAAREKFIVAYPSANPPRAAWDFSHGSADVAYLREVVLDISGTWCVDPHRVHVEGHSSGALMAARLACDAPDVFASIAVYAGVDPTLLGSPCAQDQASGRPISMGIFHGINDDISRFPLAIEHRDKWIKRNDCSSIPTTEPNVQVEASVYGPCRAGVEVVWRVYNAGHLWPQGPDHADITSRMWAFFQRNPLP